MSNIINSCLHKNEIITESEYVCSDCGLCLDNFFEKPADKTQKIFLENNPMSLEITNHIKESLERLNLPTYLYKFIVKSIQKKIRKI